MSFKDFKDYNLTDLYVSEARLGLHDNKMTATEIRLKQQEYSRKIEAIVEAIHMNVKPSGFPTRFLRVHEDALQQGYYSGGEYFEILAIEPVGKLDGLIPGAVSLIGVHARQAGDKMVFEPLSALDRMSAEKWEKNHEKYSDDLFQAFYKIVNDL